MEKERNRQRLGSCRCCCCWFCWWSVKFSVVLFAPAPTLPLFKLVVLCLFFSFAFHRPNVNENADAAACVTSAGKKTSRSSSHSFEVFPLNQLSLLSLSLTLSHSAALSLSPFLASLSVQPRRDGKWHSTVASALRRRADRRIEAITAALECILPTADDGHSAAVFIQSSFSRSSGSLPTGHSLTVLGP